MDSKHYYDGNMNTDWAHLNKKVVYSTSSINKPLNDFKVDSGTEKSYIITANNDRFKNLAPASTERMKKQKFINFMPQE